MTDGELYARTRVLFASRPECRLSLHERENGAVVILADEAAGTSRVQTAVEVPATILHYGSVETVEHYALALRRDHARRVVNARARQREAVSGR